MNADVVTEQWIESSPNHSVGEHNSLIGKFFGAPSALDVNSLFGKMLWCIPSVCLSLLACTYECIALAEFLLECPKGFFSFVNKEFSL